jgi:predicted TPR repeat methyltransferase
MLTGSNKIAAAPAIQRAAQFLFRFPPASDLNQDEEYCEVQQDNQWRRIRFHDYHELFAIPGLYEALFYSRLKCCSPARVASLLDDVLSDFPHRGGELRVLDVGAGNGMMGQEMRHLGATRVVGIDIIPEARIATDRDRPGVYDEYHVADLTKLSPTAQQKIRDEKLNCLTCVAALGFGDIPPHAFAVAYDLIAEKHGWLAFTIKQDFLNADCDVSGFAGLVRQLRADGYIEVQAYRRYRHRLSVSGTPLYYVAMVATKKRDIPAEWIAKLAEQA